MAAQGPRGAVLQASDALFLAATERYGRPGITPFIMDVLIESVAPLARPSTKDYARQRVRDEGGTLDAGAFAQVMYSVLVADNVHHADFVERARTVTAGLEREAQRGKGTSALSMVLAAAPPKAVTPAPAALNSPEVNTKVGEGEPPVSAAADGAQPVADTGSSPTAVLPSRAMEREAAHHRTISDLEAELSELKRRFGVEDAADPVAAPRAGLGPIARIAPAPQPTTQAQPVAVANDPAAAPEPSAEAAAAVRMLQERCARTQAALDTANRRLGDLCNPLDPQSIAVANARAVAAGTWASPSRSQHYDPSPQRYQRFVADRSATGYAAPSGYAGYTSPLAAHRERAPQTAGWVAPSPSLSPPSCIGHRTHADRFLDSIGIGSGAAEEALSPLRCPPTDTLLSTGLPIHVEDARSMFTGRVSLHGVDERGVAVSSPKQSLGLPSADGRRYASRMDGVYHVIGLEKEETGRWKRSFFKQ